MDQRSRYGRKFDGVAFASIHFANDVQDALLLSKRDVYITATEGW
jgi:hypothetical protein